jgi:pimeloyl-ACP methyl ester carboxylesterase
MKTFVLNGWASSEHAWDLCRFRRDRVFSYVEQLDGEPEKAMKEVDEVVLVGWSMGGSGALRLAINCPEKVKGLVLIATTPRMMKDEGWAGMTERRLAALEYGLKATKGQGFFGIPEGKPNPYMMDDEDNLKRGLEYLHETDLRKALRDLSGSGQLDFPVRIFQSEHDGIVRPDNARFLAEVFRNSRVTMVPGSEHALSIEIPEAIDEAVSGLFAESNR